MKDLFTDKTQCFIYNLKPIPIQRMLDFDYLCRRTTPSVVAVIAPGKAGSLKAFFGAKEILIPVYDSIKEAVKLNPSVDVFVNFASFRSAYDSSLEALESDSIKTVAIIAEGIPERLTKQLIAVAKKKNKCIIGPASVGGLSAGKFRIGNTAGTIENIIACKLYRPGSVGFVSKSGGLSNEMFNVISRNADGIYEGIAIGGDAYPGSRLIDHILRFEKIPDIKMIVALGEVGGTEEYEITDALKTNKITKPVVMWVTGTCAKVFPGEVQFGHAGAKTGDEKGSADAKNSALREAGVIVPDSYQDFDVKIKHTFDSLKKQGKIKEIKEPGFPEMPLEYTVALKQGKIRKATNFICTTSDDRGDEPHYAGIPMTKMIEENYSLGDVISLLWFRKRLPSYASKFIETVLLIVADHGPCVSGAHNAIVSSRAGKDLVSSLCSGLLTIGPRFGGAIDDSARFFKHACDSKTQPDEFVEDMKKKGINIPGIGHRIKSAKNPDKRVEILKNYAKKHFPHTKYLDYALLVENETLKKGDNLILNVDGTIAVLFLDLIDGCKIFSNEEFDSIVDVGYLNGLFVLARSIGIMGHVFDQKRLKQPLYRHPWDDVLFLD